MRRAVGWGITQDGYRREFKDGYPVGADFAALQARYRERMRQRRTLQSKLEGPLGPRPTGAIPTGGR